jgi:CheY-like chemotaxis protein
MISDKEERSCSIVLIDDDEVIHFILAKLMTTLYPDKTFLCLSSAEEALELFRSNRLSADLIVLDVDMPHMNGWAFLNRLKELKYSKPVCMLSSSTSPRDVERINEYPMVKTYLVKPLYKSTLEKIMTYLEKTSP